MKRENDDENDQEFVFWTVYWSAYILLIITTSLLFVAINNYFFKRSSLGGLGILFVMPLMVLSRIIATKVCRRMGISRDGHAIQVLRRGESHETIQRDFVRVEYEMRQSAKIWASLAWACGLFSLLILIRLSTTILVLGTEIYGFPLLVVFVLGALGCVWAWGSNFGFIGRADARGVIGYHWFNPKPKAVLWDNIETCEITILHDAMGNLTHPFFVFKDHKGNILLRMQTAGMPEAQTSPFKAVVERYLAVA